MITCAPIARVFAVMTFSAINVGRATSQLPDYVKAKLAASNIKKLLLLKSEINPTLPDGSKPVADNRHISRRYFARIYVFHKVLFHRLAAWETSNL